MQKILRFIRIVIPIIIFSTITSCFNSDSADFIEKLGIIVKNDSREYFYTNKISGFYYGNSNSENSNGFQGWTIDEKRILSDYSISVNNSLLSRNESKTVVYPHELFREFNDNITETFCLADSENIILLELNNIRGKSITFTLDFTDKLEKLNKQIFSILSSQFFIQVKTNLDAIQIENSNTKLKLKIDKIKIDKLQIEIEVKRNEGFDENKSFSFEEKIILKKKRIENLLERSKFESNNEELDKALAWNKISLDALITFQGNVKGIFAGLPWFNNYWGRDTFISLAGATYLIGNFEDAKLILESFSKYQDTNPNSKYFGRIPNRITINETIYNTADGTAWFVIQAYKYFKYSNDIDFLKKIYPTIKLANNAFLKKHIDDNYFLIHEDAETWMDAVGPDGAWSPRGNRANDIQALWYQQLLYSSHLAKILNDSTNSQMWFSISQKLKNNIQKYFIDTKNYLVYDHLKSNNDIDSSIRPNAFFVLNAPEVIDSYKLKLNVISKLFDNLVIPQGAFSLSYKDSNFHPFHHYEPYYVQDAAYHNGTIWLWNTGPIISSLLSFNQSELAYEMTNYLVDETLNHNATGTIPELFDALPKEKNERLKPSGTFTQAWSMAEFIRNIYEDYLGVDIDLNSKLIYLLPSLPKDLTYIKFSRIIDNRNLEITYKKNENEFSIFVNGKYLKDSVDIAVSYVNSVGTNYLCKFNLKPNNLNELRIDQKAFDKEGISLYVNSNPVQFKVMIRRDTKENEELYKKIKFANPIFNPNWKSIKQIDYLLLSNEEIKKVNQNAQAIFNIDDNKVIDNNYSYPKNFNFQKGILDFDNFELKQDEDNYYFKLHYANLVNPGWHNSYGYQLTFTAIAIQNDISSKTNNLIGANSNYILSNDRKFNKIIFIGGGIEIKDGENNKIAAYIPKDEDVKNPLGNTKNKAIEFSIPKKLLGIISKNSKITILVGAQDDHGGAGIGEFRNVGTTATEWEGGGKKDKNSTNVYQILKIN